MVQHGTVGAGDTPFGDPITLAWLTELEQSTNFWNRTPQLQRIAYVAAQEDVSPWGLLMGVELHRLSHIKPTVVLVKRSGNAGSSLVEGTSLNMFGGLTGDSGAGKSTLFKLASSLLPPKRTPISDGTGQGLVKSIAETEKVTRDENGQPIAEPYYITRFNTHSLIIHAPEIKTLNAEFAREGSKTDSIMRSMWSGETVGMTTGDRDRRATLPANTYRVVGMWGVQPVNATEILKGIANGDPQRWLWMPAEERRLDMCKARVNPGHVDFPMPVFGNQNGNPFGISGGELPVEYKDGDPLPSPIWVHWSPMMAKEIDALHARRKQLRNRDPYADITPEQRAAETAVNMEAHLILTRIKLAAVIGFVHGRANPSDLDWELAGIQLSVSTGELAGIWKRIAQEVKQQARERGVIRGLEMFYSQESRAEAEDNALQAFATEMWQMLCAEGPRSNKELRTWAGGNVRRGMVTKALERLEGENKLAVDRNRMYWGLFQGTPMPPEKTHLFV